MSKDIFTFLTLSSKNALQIYQRTARQAISNVFAPVRTGLPAYLAVSARPVRLQSKKVSAVSIVDEGIVADAKNSYYQGCEQSMQNVCTRCVPDVFDVS